MSIVIWQFARARCVRTIVIWQFAHARCVRKDARQLARENSANNWILEDLR